MDKITYMTQGVCCKQIDLEVENGIIQKCRIVGGCPGNLLGISKIIIGMDVNRVIERFEGNRCGGKPTSCPDQIAKALIQKYR